MNVQPWDALPGDTTLFTGIAREDIQLPEIFPVPMV